MLTERCLTVDLAAFSYGRGGAHASYTCDTLDTGKGVTRPGSVELVAAHCGCD